MLLANKIKLMLKYGNVSGADYMRALGLARLQALNNKYVRNVFSVHDLAVLAELTDTELAFINHEGEAVMKIGKDDLKTNYEKERK